MKRLPYLFLVLALLIIGEVSTVQAATTVAKVFNGGTGVGTFTSSQLIYGNSTNPLSSVATTTLTGSGVISISNAPVLIGASPAVATLAGGSNGQVLGWLSGIPTWTASSTVAAGTGISVSTTGSVNTVSLTNTTISGVALGGTLAALTALDTTLTLSGSYTGATARTVGLNLGNANTWTALQQFNGNASSSMLSANLAQFGATATTTLGTDGKITGNDIANSWLGRISPTRSFALQTGTSTTMTGSTTAPYIPYVIAPFAGTLRTVRCKTDTGTMGVEPQINGVDAAPGYINASTTVGKTTFTSANTFSAGDKLSMINGTPASTPTTISCTFDTTETP